MWSLTYCCFILLQDNQRDLESVTETLSEYLEREITSGNLDDIKQKVQDKYRYVFIIRYRGFVIKTQLRFSLTCYLFSKIGTVIVDGRCYWSMSMRAMSASGGSTSSSKTSQIDHTSKCARSAKLVVLCITTLSLQITKFKLSEGVKNTYICCEICMYIDYIFSDLFYLVQNILYLLLICFLYKSVIYHIQ